MEQGRSSAIVRAFASGPAMRILVIDDHEEVLELVERSLVRDQHDVLSTTHGQEAFKLIDKEHPDLVVLDLGLEDVSGEALCRRIRERHAALVILILTAQSAVASRVRCLDAGADDYLTKPFAVAELRARVRALGRRLARPRLGQVTRGQVRIDFSARRASVGRAEAPITAREWALLEMLAERNGELVRREELLEAIWNKQGSAAAASLEVLIGRIRRKLGNDLVRTVRGEGYSLGD